MPTESRQVICLIDSGKTVAVEISIRAVFICIVAVIRRSVAVVVACTLVRVVRAVPVTVTRLN